MAESPINAASLQKAGRLLQTEAQKYRTHLEIGEALVEAGDLVALVEKAVADLERYQTELAALQAKAQADADNMATLARDEAMKEAQAKADKILSDAQAEADRKLEETAFEIRRREGDADRLFKEAQAQRSAALEILDKEITERTGALASIEARYNDLEQKLADLRKAVA